MEAQRRERISRLRWLYIDGYAGSGHHVSKTSGDLVEGSPLIALNTNPPFHEYHFIDSDTGKAAELRKEAGDRPDLLDRPRLSVCSRSDLGDASDDVGDRLQISAVTGAGVPQLVGALRPLVEQTRSEEPVPETYAVHRPVPEGIRITRHDDASFEVLGRDASRAVALSDLTNPEALDFAHQRLAALGVDRALGRAGARNGDVVRIGSLSFVYETSEPFVFVDETS